jgi:hypothetical protein
VESGVPAGWRQVDLDGELRLAGSERGVDRHVVTPVESDGLVADVARRVGVRYRPGDHSVPRSGAVVRVIVELILRHHREVPA